MRFAAANSNTNIYRARRLRAFLDLAYDIADTKGRPCRVVDIGGTSGFWNIWNDQVDWERIEVTCFNLRPEHCRVDFDRVTVRYGDATNLSDVDDNAFDFAHSNSVIEHVGRQNFAAFAREVRRIAPAYFVQTPNYWFPYEPHARTPFIHWVPDTISARIVMWRKCGYWPREATYEAAIARLRTAELLTRSEMRELFPDAELIGERAFGMVKSWMAVRH